MRRRLVVIVVAGVATAIAIGPGRTVLAHASLVATDPAPDAVVDAAPSEIRLEFDDPVSVDLGGIRVFDPSGGRADTGATTTTDGGTVVLVGLLDAGLGTYTVAWSAVSGDSHVLSGSYLFHVQTRTGGVTDLGDGDRTGLDLTGWIARWFLYTGTTVLAGVAVFRLVVRGRHPLDDPATVRMVRLAAIGMLIGGAGRLLVQVADASGRSLSGVLGLLTDAVTDTRAGRLDAIRVGLAALAVAATMLWRRPAAAATALLATVATMVTLALSGHAWTVDVRWTAVVVDTVHQAGAAVWIGGLAAVAVSLAHARGPVHWAARRFSQLAVGSVVVLAVTGAASGWWQTAGNIEALVTSRYGAILGLKLAAVAVMVAVGYWQRTHLLAAVDQTGRLLSTSRSELAIGALVLAATAALVNTVPARESVTPDPYAANITDDIGPVSITLDPAATGTNVMHLYFFDANGASRTVDVAEATITTAGLPPRDITLIPITASHYTATDITIPSTGRWTLTVTTLSRGTPATLTAEIAIT